MTLYGLNSTELEVASDFASEAQEVPGLLAAKARARDVSVQGGLELDLQLR